MARLIVGDYTFNFNSVRTVFYDMQPALDPSGSDYECVKLTVEIAGVVSSVTLNSGGKDNLTTSLIDFNEQLMRPRQDITYIVNGVTIIDTPPAGQGSDARGGPIVENARFTQFTGDQIAMMTFRFHTHLYLLEPPIIVLSNRWTMTSSVDQYGMTTQTTRGRTKFNKGALDAAGLEPDDFRNAFVVQMNPGMRRVAINVTANDAGDEAVWTATDKEIVYGLGANSPILKVECTTTGGVSNDIRSTKDILRVAARGVYGTALIAASAVDLVRGGGWGAAGGAAGAKELAAASLASMPSARLFGTVTVWGRNSTTASTMATVAVSWILDRFGPSYLPTAVGRRASIASMFMTFNWDSEDAPYCQVRVDILGLSPLIVGGALASGNPSRMLNLTESIEMGGGLGAATPERDAPDMESSNNTRGGFLGRMISQTLLVPGGGLPDPVPDTEDALDNPLE